MIIEKEPLPEPLVDSYTNLNGALSDLRIGKFYFTNAKAITRNHIHDCLESGMIFNSVVSGAKLAPFRLQYLVIVTSYFVYWFSTDILD